MKLISKKFFLATLLPAAIAPLALFAADDYTVENQPQVLEKPSLSKMQACSKQKEQGRSLSRSFK